MIAASVSPRDRRALRLGALVAGPVLLWRLALAPYAGALTAAEQRLAGERAQLARELGTVELARREPVAPDAVARRLRALRPRLFATASVGTAGAALTSHVQALADDARVLVSQIEPAAPTGAGPALTAIPLRLQGESDLEGLLGFLHAIESDEKLLLVDEIEVRAADGGPARAAAPARGAQPGEVLGFTVTLRGYADLPFATSATGRAP